MATEKDYYIHIHFTVQDDVIDETVSVTEEVYRTYKRSIWNDDRKKKREARCLIIGKNGLQKRCREDCSQCPNYKSGTPYSVEAMQEQGLDIPDQNTDVEEAAIYGELLEALMEVLDELDPAKRAITQAIMDGKSERTAAKELGYASQSSYNYQKNKLLKALKERLEKYR